MGWLVLGSRPAGDRGVRSDSKEVWKQDPKSECPSRANGRGSTETEVPALMKVLIGVDPHKASVAGAVVDEAGGELVERASFPQNRAGLRSLERWAKRFPERRWAVENASGLGRHLAGRLAAAGESAVAVAPPSFRRGCGFSLASLATPARTTGSMPWPPPWQPRATGGWQWSIPRPPRSCCDSFPRGARIWWPSVPGR